MTAERPTDGDLRRVWKPYLGLCARRLRGFNGTQEDEVLSLSNLRWRHFGPEKFRHSTFPSTFYSTFRSLFRSSFRYFTATATRFSGPALVEMSFSALEYDVDTHSGVVNGRSWAWPWWMMIRNPPSLNVEDNV